MIFAEKADYTGDSRLREFRMLDYRGKIGPQYNPIAISQYGLGNYNLLRAPAEANANEENSSAADWLSPTSNQNLQRHVGVEPSLRLGVSGHPKAPWYSGLAQGQGISLLVRAHRETGDERYLDAARARLSRACGAPCRRWGAIHRRVGDLWIEEYIVDPPTHILNGFIWASWGVYDYFLTTRDASAQELFDAGCPHSARNLDRYDIGFWSLYEQSGTRLKMVASPFYHHFTSCSCAVMHQFTGNNVFRHRGSWDAMPAAASTRTAPSATRAPSSCATTRVAVKILYVSQYYPPEMGAPAARAVELARHWVRAGHDVTVLTGFPNHPTGVVPPEWRSRWRRLVVFRAG